MEDNRENEKEYLEWLTSLGHLNATRIPNTDKWFAFERLIFHWSLIGGPMYDKVNVNYRYCYRDLPLLAHSFEEWKAKDFEGEPENWHKKRGLTFDKNTKIQSYNGEVEELMDAIFAMIDEQTQ